MSIFLKLAKIQQEISAPKGQFNKFGGYSYRSAEDIQQAVKPLLGDLVLTLNDSIEMVGDRIYVKSTATLTDGAESVNNAAFAREPLHKKGMDESQITGASSSYARKYALAGLLLLDDSSDADGMDNQEPEKPWFNNAEFDDLRDRLVTSIRSGDRTPDTIVENLKTRYKVSNDMAKKIGDLNNG